MNEFEFLADLRSKYSLCRTGDDCAVLPLGDAKDLLVTADMLVDTVDFRTEWAIPEFLGHKSLAVSLSDIAAMGGTPKWSMLSLGVPEPLWNSDFLNNFYEGYFALANKYDVELVGGDISRVPDQLVIDSIVGGEVQKGKAILRSTARPGDVVFVSGRLGGAAGGLKLLESGTRYTLELRQKTADLLLKQLRPEPELAIAKSLQEVDILTSAIDLSDGLSSDLAHICSQSGVGAEIEADKLPIEVSLAHFFTRDECLEMALNGGEDLRLLFTVDPKKIAAAQSSGATAVGKITQAGAGIVLIDTNGPRPLLPSGFRHF